MNESQESRLTPPLLYLVTITVTTLLHKDDCILQTTLIILCNDNRLQQSTINLLQQQCISLTSVMRDCAKLLVQSQHVQWHCNNCNNKFICYSANLEEFLDAHMISSLAKV
eukprot:2705-Heterococcus_DN1.PRE.2